MLRGLCWGGVFSEGIVLRESVLKEWAGTGRKDLGMLGEIYIMVDVGLRLVCTGKRLSFSGCIMFYRFYLSVYTVS